jgi:AbrB family looped-hinge helix DNA binding protein
MMKHHRHEKLTIRQGGRVIIPAQLRAELGLNIGDELIATVDNGELKLSTLKERIRRLQELLAPYKKPGESVVDDFIADRRTEAAKE